MIDMGGAPMGPRPGPGTGRVPSPGPTAPAGVNVQNQGEFIEGKILAGIAMMFLEQAIPKLSTKTQEGVSALKMLEAGTKLFGPPPKELGAQELKLAAARLPAVPGPGPDPMDAMQRKAGSMGMNVASPLMGAA